MNPSGPAKRRTAALVPHIRSAVFAGRTSHECEFTTAHECEAMTSHECECRTPLPTNASATTYPVMSYAFTRPAVCVQWAVDSKVRLTARAKLCHMRWLGLGSWLCLGR